MLPVFANQTEGEAYLRVPENYHKYVNDDSKMGPRMLDMFRSMGWNWEQEQPQPTAPATDLRGAAPNANAEQTQTLARPPQANFVDPLPDVPAAMKAQHQWVRWKLEPGSNGTMTKVPYCMDGRKASSTNPDDWADYKTAITGAEINSSGGVGFMFTNGFMGIDLDGCRDPKTGDITKWAEDIIDSLGDVYVEASPSGTGLHIFVLGKVPGTDRKLT